MVIERNCRLISNLDTGATARLRSGSRRLDVPVSGVVFDPAQAPATQDHFVYGYADRATWASLSGQEICSRHLHLGPTLSPKTGERMGHPKFYFFQIFFSKSQVSKARPGAPEIQ